MSNILSKSVLLASPTIRTTSRAIISERLLPIFENSAASQSPVEILKLNVCRAHLRAYPAYADGVGHAHARSLPTPWTPLQPSSLD